MASKGKGKGKSSLLAQNQNNTSTKEFEGAVDSRYYIRAQKLDNNWCDARIILCRLLKEFETSKKKKNQYSYEYYVHYIRHNRRMDEWITRDRIELTENLIPEKQTQKVRKVTHSGKDQDDEHDRVYKCETWYYSPLPSGYQHQECVYFCEFCLSFYISKNELQRHMQKCKLTHPPGDEIYRDETREQSISMFEVDGAKNSLYCENLGFLSKLFLDHKNLYYNLEPFLFFILCENDQYGSHIVGYFSKQKESEQGWNLNCILTLPCYQRKGYGKFLITFSYELSIIEGKLGTPEKPLSDLGKQTYLSWWTQRIIDYMKTVSDTYPFSIKDLEKQTGIKDKDIIYTLEQTGLIKYTQGKVAICTDRTFLDKLFKEAGRPGLPVYTYLIHWIPYYTKQEKICNINFVNYDPLAQN